MFSNLKNKKILITGNTGFKGAWLSLFLKKVGAYVVGYSDKIEWKNSIFTNKNIIGLIVSLEGKIVFRMDNLHHKEI